MVLGRAIVVPSPTIEPPVRYTRRSVLSHSSRHVLRRPLSPLRHRRTKLAIGVSVAKHSCHLQTGGVHDVLWPYQKPYRNLGQPAMGRQVGSSRPRHSDAETRRPWPRWEGPGACQLVFLKSLKRNPRNSPAPHEPELPLRRRARSYLQIQRN